MLPEMMGGSLSGSGIMCINNATTPKKIYKFNFMGSTIVKARELLYPKEVGSSD